MPNKHGTKVPQWQFTSLSPGREPDYLTAYRLMYMHVSVNACLPVYLRACLFFSARGPSQHPCLLRNANLSQDNVHTVTLDLSKTCCVCDTLMSCRIPKNFCALYRLPETTTPSCISQYINNSKSMTTRQRKILCVWRDSNWPSRL